MRTVAACFGGLITLFSLVAVVDAAESHCQEQEQVIFSCSLGEKTVSVCASNDFSANSGYLQYRFGPLDMLELSFPTVNDASAPATQFIQARSLMFAGGGGGYLRFINGWYHYIVYTAIGKGWGTKDGVAVQRKHQLIANLECQDVPVSEISTEFFTRAGLSIDRNEFEIPGLD
ncbi:hypothetical protein [uncultured Nitrosomonas sp.]|uniref:hypothetical protein n=1 Tax=uncultured Nitrosomonas sp. TaxID=156424 RepID=UPI0025E00004|nr:hypothetical protein [uncultured Nitrosomonas sp.]